MIGSPTASPGPGYLIIKTALAHNPSGFGTGPHRGGREQCSRAWGARYDRRARLAQLDPGWPRRGPPLRARQHEPSLWSTMHCAEITSRYRLLRVAVASTPRSGRGGAARGRRDEGASHACFFGTGDEDADTIEFKGYAIQCRNQTFPGPCLRPRIINYKARTTPLVSAQVLQQGERSSFLRGHGRRRFLYESR